MFPAISEIGVEVNHHHQPTIVIINTETLCRETVALFISPSPPGCTSTRNLHQFVNFKEAVKKWMRNRDVFRFTFREDFFQLLIKLFPLPTTMEIIYQDKTTTQKIFAHVLCFLRCEAQSTHLQHISKRVFKEFFGADVNDFLFWRNFDIRMLAKL